MAAATAAAGAGVVARAAPSGDGAWSRMLRVAAAAGAAALALGVAWLGSRRLLRKAKRTHRVWVDSIYVYPVKGCRGHPVASAEMTPWGLKGDRMYMIVNSKDVFMTQREMPKMALIHPDMATPEGLVLRAVAPDGAGSVTLPAPFFVPRVGELESVPRPCSIWLDTVPGVDQGDAAARWLQSFLGKDGLRLMLIADSAKRVTDPEYGVGETSFTDGFPILVTSQASVDDVNRRIKSGVRVTVNNFRPNVHIGGCGAFDEDEMRKISFRSGAAQLSLIKPCSRCTVTTVDPRTGTTQANSEPLRTLREFRSTDRLQRTAQLHKAFYFKPEQASQVYFGQNALVRFTPGTALAVGDEGAVEWC